VRNLTRPGEFGSFLPGGRAVPWTPPRPRAPVLSEGLPRDRPGPEKVKVLITGGSSGIGAATAEAFAARGYLVAVTGRDVTALDRVAGLTGGVSVPGDLRDPGGPRRVVDAAAAALGGLDVVVSNAGVGWAGSFMEMTEKELDELLDVNLRAPAHVVHAALAHLRPETGHLVFVGSIAGLLGVAGETWYSATKAGVAMLADVLRAELHAEHIGLSLVIPGVVATPYFDRRQAPYQRRFPRPIAAQVVADAIVDAVEHQRDTVIVPEWLGWPARLKAAFPALYRKLERSLDSEAKDPRGGGRNPGGGGRMRRYGGKRAPVVGSAGPWPRDARA
jgi:NAD(P)-dependent dehydrogenase (short-subunit alcohol dehydrogenase family)